MLCIRCVDKTDTIVYHDGEEVASMEFYSVRDFRTASKAVWASLSKGSEVVITNNGKLNVTGGALGDSSVRPCN